MHLFLELANELKEISSCALHTFNFHNTLKFTDAIISLYIKRLEQPMVMRTVLRKDIDALPYSGGFVLSPKVGFHNWIMDLDASSMYPSIIRTLNISPETYICQVKNITDEMREYLVGLHNDIGETSIIVSYFDKKITIRRNKWII